LFNKILLCMILVVSLFGEKIDVSSNEMKVNQNTKEIYFIGNAKVIQDKSFIYADKIIVYFNDDNMTKEYEAIKNVSFEFVKPKSHYKGKANKVIYLPLDDIYILEGNAYVTDLINKRVIKGDKITLDTKSGNANVKGSRKKPVKCIFEMENKK